MTQRPSNDQSSSPSSVMQGLALAQMLAARLCHDMAGVVGTLSGALELADDPDSAAESLEVAQDAARVLQARLRLLRTAFAASDQPLSFAELAELLNGHPLSRRVSLRLDMMSPTRQWPGAQARLLLCLVMLGVESLAGEGELAMQEAEDGSVLVALTGPRAIWPAGFATHLANPDSALEHATDQGPRGVLGPLVALLAPAAGARLQLLIGAVAETAPPLVVSFR